VSRRHLAGSAAALRAAARERAAVADAMLVSL
jgi:hypothetical protein